MSNFLNKKQIKELEAKDWEVKPRCAYINLYADDFGWNDAWDQICEQLEVDPAQESVTVLYVGVIQK